MVSVLEDEKVVVTLDVDDDSMPQLVRILVGVCERNPHCAGVLTSARSGLVVACDHDDAHRYPGAPRHSHADDPARARG